jgi:hypothetical protein
VELALPPEDLLRHTRSQHQMHLVYFCSASDKSSAVVVQYSELSLTGCRRRAHLAVRWPLSPATSKGVHVEVNVAAIECDVIRGLPPLPYSASGSVIVTRYAVAPARGRHRNNGLRDPRPTGSVRQPAFARVPSGRRIRVAILSGDLHLPVRKTFRSRCSMAVPIEFTPQTPSEYKFAINRSPSLRDNRTFKVDGYGFGYQPPRTATRHASATGQFQRTQAQAQRPQQSRTGETGLPSANPDRSLDQNCIRVVDAAAPAARHTIHTPRDGCRLTPDRRDRGNFLPICGQLQR